MSACTCTCVGCWCVCSVYIFYISFLFVFVASYRLKLKFKRHRGGRYKMQHVAAQHRLEPLLLFCRWSAMKRGRRRKRDQTYEKMAHLSKLKTEIEHAGLLRFAINSNLFVEFCFLSLFLYRDLMGYFATTF